MFTCVFHYTFFAHVVFMFKTCIRLYLSWSAYVSICLFLYLQYCVNMSLQIAKLLGHYNGFKQFSNFLVKGESVPPDTFSRESKPYCKT